MEGFILAAGLGTRLRPLTDTRPKALVEVEGVCLLERVIHKMEGAGIHHIVVNVHHFGQMVIDFIHSRQWGCDIDISDERACLLDTGGGLKKASSLLSGKEAVVVHNVDILSDVDLRHVGAQHTKAGNLVTMCVSRRPTARMLLFSPEGQLLGRKGEVEGKLCEEWAYSGISVVHPDTFALLPPATTPYPIIPCLISMAADHPVRHYVRDAAGWFDVGKPESLKEAQLWIHSLER